jgi:hypothetical protein
MEVNEMSDVDPTQQQLSPDRFLAPEGTGDEQLIPPDEEDSY